MPTNIFISYDHDDQRQVAGFNLIKTNSKHPLDFRNHSLKEPVTDRSGKPIIYPPSDSRSKPVRDEIIGKFENASKLVVLIGSNTCTSEWVDWEILTFYNLKYSLSGDKTWQRIRGMRLRDAAQALIPAALGRRSTQVLNWDPAAMGAWIEQDPDA